MTYVEYLKLVIEEAKRHYCMEYSTGLCSINHDLRGHGQDHSDRLDSAITGILKGTGYAYLTSLWGMQGKYGLCLSGNSEMAKLNARIQWLNELIAKEQSNVPR